MQTPARTDRRIARTRMYFYIYVAVFGVIWGLGASVLAGTLPPEPFTRAIVFGWYDMIILFLTKLIVRRPLSVSAALTIAGVISCFTFSFGPPNPYKWAFGFAGLAFDAGTLFRTRRLRYWNLVVGLLVYVPVIYSIFAAIIYIVDREAFHNALGLIYTAAAVYLVEGLIASALAWKFLGGENPPKRVEAIWRQLGIVE
jgi:hypothetical protein